MHVLGNPGGRIHLRNGFVISVESPGAPGPDSLLMRSGRVSESEWTTALSTGAELRSHQAELVACGNVGSTELHVVAMMAAHDAAFAVVAGDVTECALSAETLDVAVPMSTGVEPVRLLQETSRRISSLLALPHPLAPHRDRVAPRSGVTPSDLDISPVRREILAHATGRRNARDIAFACGRSVYVVTIEVCRMVGEGLLTVVPGMTVTTSREPPVPLRPRHPQAPPPSPRPPQNPSPDSPAGDDSDDVPLPRSLVRHLLPKIFKQPERKKL